MIRLSGLLTDRPPAGAAQGARYYATDEEIIHTSAGENWLAGVVTSEVVNQISGELGSRPDPQTCIGWVFTDTTNGNQYEAFPDGWALVNDLSPAATAMGVVIHGATANTPRLSGYSAVTWIGSVEPENAEDNDIWEDTT